MRRSTPSFSLLTSTVKPRDLVSASANLPSRAAENLFWFGRYGERCDGTARLLRVAIADVLDEARRTRRCRARRPLMLAERFGLIDGGDDVGRAAAAGRHPPRRGPERALAPAVAGGLQPARPHVGGQLAQPEPAGGRPGFPARPAVVDGPAAGAGLAGQGGHLDDDAVGFRARRHDPRRRLALPVDGPAHRAPVHPVHHAAGRHQRGPHPGPGLAARARRLDRHLPLALPGRAGVAAGARPAAARRGQSRARSAFRSRACPSTSPSWRCSMADLPAMCSTLPW